MMISRIYKLSFIAFVNIAAGCGPSVHLSQSKNAAVGNDAEVQLIERGESKTYLDAKCNDRDKTNRWSLTALNILTIPGGVSISFDGLTEPLKSPVFALAFCYEFDEYGKVMPRTIRFEKAGYIPQEVEMPPQDSLNLLQIRLVPDPSDE